MPDNVYDAIVVGSGISGGWAAKELTEKMIEEYPVLKRDYPLNERSLNWWVKDSECPYTETKRFDWFRGYHVGGRSLMLGRQTYRWSNIDFEANAKQGV